VTSNFQVEASIKGVPDDWYHITRRAHLKSIFEEGLKPQGAMFRGFKRARSSIQNGVYLFRTEDDARLGGSTQFMRETNPDEWHILEVNVPEYCELKRDPEFSLHSRINAWIAYCTIPPQYITYLYPVMSAE